MHPYYAIKTLGLIFKNQVVKELTRMKGYLLPMTFMLVFYWPVACTSNEGDLSASVSQSSAATSTRRDTTNAIIATVAVDGAQ
jgi:hypothetical protein